MPILKTLCSLPNLLSLFRLFTAFLLPVFFLNNFFKIAAVFFFLACLSDWLDGYFARLLKQESTFGARLDPVADKILIFSIYLCGSLFGLVPLWLTGMIILRDVLILLGAFIAIHYHWRVSLSPLMISKINTLVQMTYALFIIGNLFISFDKKTTLMCYDFLSALVTITTLGSGFCYFYIFIKGWKHRNEG